MIIIYSKSKHKKKHYIIKIMLNKNFSEAQMNTPTS